MSPIKVALIFGITGQDGSYLAELLIQKGYIVHGARRRSSSFNTSRIDHLIENSQIWNSKFFLHHCDLSDQSSIDRLLTSLNVDEIYNLAAQSHVGVSFEQPLYTSDINALGTLRILESIVRNCDIKNVKYYQASTSELFGLRKLANDGLLNEASLFQPQSPYAVSKQFAFQCVELFRASHNLFAVNGILFNHESERRGETFVTRKITRALSRIKVGIQSELLLGNLNACRDWGHAKDYVRAMQMMLQLDSPTDLVIATGMSVTVRNFVEMVAVRLDFDLEWSGVDAKEIGIDRKTGNIIVRVDRGYFRPLEVDYLRGDASKALSVMGWRPTISLDELVDEMTHGDLLRAKNESVNPGIFRI